MREQLARAREAGAQLVLFPELAITGYPPEDLLLKEHFLADARAAVERIAADAHGHRRASSASPSAPTTSTTPRRCSPTARVQAIYRKVHLPNYGVFDELRYFQRGPGRGDHRGRRRQGRPDDLRGHLGARAADDRRGAGRRAADRQHLRLALPRRQGRRARADDRPARARQPRRGRLLRAGRRPGRARLRRPLVRRRPRRRRRSPARRSSPRSCWSATSTSQAAGRRAPARHPPRARRARERGAGGRRPRRRSRTDGGREHAAGAGRPGRRAARRRRRGLRGARARHARLRRRKNGFEHVVLGLSGGIDSTLVALHRRRRARARARDLRDDALALLLAGHAQRRPRAGREPRRRAARAADRASRWRPTSELLARRLRRPRAGPHRGEPAGAHPRQPADGAVEQVRLARAHDRQQVGDVGRLLDALRRQRGRLRGHQGRARRRSSTGSWPSAPRARRAAVAVPESIVTRPPSAELRPDQRDEDSLPPYEVLDAILEGYVEQDLGREQLIARGLPPRPTSTASSASSTSPSTSAARTRRASRSPRKAFGRDRRVPITNRYGG